MNKIVCGVILLMGLLQAASAQYSGWQHSGSVYLLTTPEGANLPASASEDGFPLLVRLHKDSFNFGQAKANGEDIRFSTSTGTPLAYQIEEWDATNGTTSVWVRIPTIKGNERQEIKLYWGKADAAGLAGGVGLAPIQFEFLAFVAFDGRYTHPDAGRSLCRVPFLNLICQGRACACGETDVLSLGLGLAEVEEVLMQPHQQREAVFRSRCRQIGAVRSSKDVEGT